MTDTDKALAALIKPTDRIKLSTPFTGLSRCPQCRSAKPTLELNGMLYRERNPTKSLNPSWAIYQCTSCGDPICFLIEAPIMDEPQRQRYFIQQQTPFALEMRPDGVDDFSDWPERARRYMQQAVETLHAPDAAVMLAGSAVDAMLKEKGLTNGSVYARIEEAVQAHMLTAEMGEWAHSVRLAANSPRHADLTDPHATTADAATSLDFAKALGQFLFVLPARIQRGREAAALAIESASNPSDNFSS